jgi:endonuclease/exonuclease/phosphatase (EEP) superfamily protein YafD
MEHNVHRASIIAGDFNAPTLVDVSNHPLTPFLTLGGYTVARTGSTHEKGKRLDYVLYKGAALVVDTV